MGRTAASSHGAGSFQDYSEIVFETVFSSGCHARVLRFSRLSEKAFSSNLSRTSFAFFRLFEDAFSVKVVTHEFRIFPSV
jgi:hypothetical protein